MSILLAAVVVLCLDVAAVDHGDVSSDAGAFVALALALLLVLLFIRDRNPHG